MYFKQFANIQYKGKTSKNLLARPKIVEDVMGTTEAFYDFIIPDGLRAEQVAEMYYDDPEYVWLIYLANNIVDPYYEWPLNQRQLDEHVINKYGSIAAAKSTNINYKHKTTGAIITNETFTLNGTFNNIAANDYVATNAYTEEEELNEAKRTIKLIDKKYASQMKSELKKAMNA